MAETTENTGESLNQVAVAEVAQPQTQATETSQEETHEAPQSGEQTAASQADSSPQDESLEEIPLEKLEEKLTAKKTDEQTPAEPKAQETKPEVKQVDESQTGLSQVNKPRSENRFQALANENKVLKEQLALREQQALQGLAKEIGIPTPPWEQEQNGNKSLIPPLKVEPGSEIKPEEYQKHVSEAAEKIAAAKTRAYELQVQERIQRQQQILQLDEAMNYIKQTYPELDPTHPDYSEEVDGMVGQIVESMGKINPSIIKDRVDQVMALHKQSLQAGQTQATTTLAKQMSEAAVIPGVPVRESPIDPNDIPLDELESKLGSVS